MKIFRYVTENTFDSYSWQTIENKQKFISQIMTSKSMVRSCDDIDEAALSYAEVKALAAGNPYIKEKMMLDMEVAKLRVLKAQYLSQRYRLEDDIARNYPSQIAKLTETIAAYRSDQEHYNNEKAREPEQFEMVISNKVYTNRKEAGTALLTACNAVESLYSMHETGRYLGFQMFVKLDPFFDQYEICLKRESSLTIELGRDASGNITRIQHLLESLPVKLKEAEQRLEHVRKQLRNAKEAMMHPFEKEEELKQMNERLAELNALLNVDEKKSMEEEKARNHENVGYTNEFMEEGEERMVPKERKLCV